MPSSSDTLDTVFDDPAGDLVLRSSDGVIFRFYQFLLSLQSSVFEGMWDLPQTPDLAAAVCIPGAPLSSSDYLTPLHMSENARDLRLLLTQCDPRKPDDIATITDYLTLFTLAEKYAMDALMSKLEYKLLRSTVIDSTPLPSFLVSARFRLTDCTRLAARHLALTLPPVSYTPHRYMELVSGYDLACLQKYHSAVRDAVDYIFRLPRNEFPEPDTALDLAINMLWHRSCRCPSNTPEILACPANRLLGMHSVPQHLVDYVRAWSRRMHTRADIVVAGTFNVPWDAPGCVQPSALEETGFRDALVCLVEWEVSKVRLELPWMKVAEVESGENGGC